MFKIFIFALKAGPLIIWNYLSWIIRYSRHPEKYSIEVRYNRVRKLVLKLLKRLNVVIKGENEYLIQGTETRQQDVCRSIETPEPGADFRRTKPVAAGQDRPGQLGDRRGSGTGKR